jgi:hypothetical protein
MARMVSIRPNLSKFELQMKVCTAHKRASTYASEAIQSILACFHRLQRRKMDGRSFFDIKRFSMQSLR